MSTYHVEYLHLLTVAIRDPDGRAGNYHATVSRVDDALGYRTSTVQPCCAFLYGNDSNNQFFEQKY